MSQRVELQFGSKMIAYDLTYDDRKTLGISVHPDRSVTVKAPVDTEIVDIQAKIRKRAPWILKQQSYFLSFEPRMPQKKYIGGESHYYLGRQYRIKIISSDQEIVKMDRGYFKVYTLDKSKIKPLLQSWYAAHAQIKLSEYAQEWISKFNKYNVAPKSIIIKPLKKRWGSCTAKGKIILNVDLVKANRRCIEYVILHELCHLIHHNHSRAFFNLQRKEMPDWMKWKQLLEEKYS